MAEDRYLQAYLKKLMEKEGGLDYSPLTDNELKQIALDTGLSETEWLALVQDAKHAEERGFHYLDRHNLEDAITAFKEATSLYPNNTASFYGLAKALFLKGQEQENEVLFEQALTHCDRVFTLQPNHKATLDLQSNIRKQQNIIDSKLLSKSKTSQWKKKAIIYVPIGLSLLWLIITYNSITTESENVASAWSQVENVCQSRYDKIPQLVKVVKSAVAHEESILKEVLEANHKASQLSLDADNLNQEQLESFALQQNKLSHSLQQLIFLAGKLPKLQSLESYLSLQDEIAGMENRITVERRNFNLAVKQYNQKVKRFPAMLLPFSVKPYYAVDQHKLNQPTLDL